jgi:dephospho-CoA kinase
MLVVGLTGSIGMGKSTAAQRLRSHGIPVFDADAAVHRLYEGAAVAPIAAAFPGTAPEGRVDRARLSVALAGSDAAFSKLEAIVHPLVQAQEAEFLRNAAAAGAWCAVLEVPLLFETGLDHKVDAVVVVSAAPDVQRARVLARPGMTEGKLATVLARQMPDAAKRSKADFVVDTGGPIPDTQAQIDKVVAQLRTRVPAALARCWTA